MNSPVIRPLAVKRHRNSVVIEVKTKVLTLAQAASG